MESHEGTGADAPWDERERPVKLLLTIKEAAVLLSLGRTVVYDLVRRQEIASMKVGRSRRIPVAALQEFIARHMEPPEGDSGHDRETWQQRGQHHQAR